MDACLEGWWRKQYPHQRQLYMSVSEYPLCCHCARPMLRAFAATVRGPTLSRERTLQLATRLEQTLVVRREKSRGRRGRAAHIITIQSNTYDAMSRIVTRLTPLPTVLGCMAAMMRERVPCNRLPSVAAESRLERWNGIILFLRYDREQASVRCARAANPVILLP